MIDAGPLPATMARYAGMHVGVSRDVRRRISTKNFCRGVLAVTTIVVYTALTVGWQRVCAIAPWAIYMGAI